MTYVIYAIAIFCGSFLLFWVQPMVGKIVLPLLGGVPAVWNTCMVFYQALLLAGYVYAHVSTRFLGARIQPILHVVLLSMAAIVLPVGVSGMTSPPDVSKPVTWLLSALLLSVGLPFFLISATAPLVQQWHAWSNLPGTRKPYTLYAISNLGSMAALIIYLAYIEPRLDLPRQEWSWSAGYGLLIVFMAACAFILLRNRTRIETAAVPPEAGTEDAGCRITNGQRLRWTFLAFVPSSLLLGVTTHITSDIAPVPFMWVVPLILYLATFVLVFSARQVLPFRFMASVMPFLALPLALAGFWSLEASQMIGMKFAILFHLSFFFVSAMVCHGLLAESKPSPSRLTEFYIWVALGGVLGGLFNAMVAPILFTSLVEYPLAIAAACFLRPPPSRRKGETAERVDKILAASVVGAVGALWTGLRANHAAGPIVPVLHLASLGVVLVILLLRNRPWVFGSGVAALLLAGLLSQSSEGMLYAGRNFFGTYRVYRDLVSNGITLKHGTTVHGVQYREPESVTEPQHYYARTEPFGLFFDSLVARTPLRRVGVIGLGAGTMAAYAQPGQRWTFYEVDPAMKYIAETPALFTYLADSAVRPEVILGDGRLSLVREPDAAFDLIAVDAFSSDSIPVHLFTEEALRLYLGKLRDEGLLAFHISNKYLDLAPVLTRLSRQLGRDYLHCIVNSQWFFVGHDLASFGFLVENKTCGRPDIPPDFPIWTDSASSILSILR